MQTYVHQSFSFHFQYFVGVTGILLGGQADAGEEEQ